jgi:hypothetical protein
VCNFVARKKRGKVDISTWQKSGHFYLALTHNHWTLRLLADKVVELNYADSCSYETIRQLLKKHA